MNTTKQEATMTDQKPNYSDCPETCIYKRFAQNMRNAKAHDTAIRNATLDDVVIAANFEQNRPITPFMISGWCNKLRTPSTEQP